MQTHIGIELPTVLPWKPTILTWNAQVSFFNENIVITDGLVETLLIPLLTSFLDQPIHFSLLVKHTDFVPVATRSFFSGRPVTSLTR